MLAVNEDTRSWPDVTVSMLENARKRLRDLVKLLERRKRKIVYSDFEDEIAAGTECQQRNLRPFRFNASYELTPGASRGSHGTFEIWRITPLDAGVTSLRSHSERATNFHSAALVRLLNIVGLQQSN